MGGRRGILILLIALALLLIAGGVYYFLSQRDSGASTRPTGPPPPGVVLAAGVSPPAVGAAWPDMSACLDNPKYGSAYVGGCGGKVPGLVDGGGFRCVSADRTHWSSCLYG